MKSKTMYKDGQKHGEEHEWGDDGMMSSIINYKDNKKHGLF